MFGSHETGGQMILWQLRLPDHLAPSQQVLMDSRCNDRSFRQFDDREDVALVCVGSMRRAAFPMLGKTHTDPASMGANVLSLVKSRSALLL